MKGPEHYLEAQRLLELAKANVRPRRVEACAETQEPAYTAWPTEESAAQARTLREEAAVHATRASAAAAAATFTTEFAELDDTAAAWIKATT